jgi:hypothetical protein
MIEEQLLQRYSGNLGEDLWCYLLGTVFACVSYRDPRA